MQDLHVQETQKISLVRELCMRLNRYRCTSEAMHACKETADGRTWPYTSLKCQSPQSNKCQWHHPLFFDPIIRAQIGLLLAMVLIKRMPF